MEFDEALKQFKFNISIDFSVRFIESRKITAVVPSASYLILVCIFGRLSTDFVLTLCGDKYYPT